MSYKDEAKASRADKLSRMTGKKSDAADDVEAAEGIKTVTSKSDVAPTVGSDGGAKAKVRADRPARARGGSVKKSKGKTTVNVIVAPQGGQQPSVGPALPPPGAPSMGLGAGPPPTMPSRAPGPMPPLGAGVSAAGAPGGAMPLRKRGGAVKLTAGSGSGLGRLEKTAAL